MVLKTGFVIPIPTVSPNSVKRLATAPMSINQCRFRRAKRDLRESEYEANVSYGIRELFNERIVVVRADFSEDGSQAEAEGIPKVSFL